MTYFDLHKAMEDFARSVPDDKQVELALDELCQASDLHAMSMVRARQNMLNDKDREDVSGYLAIGFFRSLHGDMRSAAWLLGLEMATLRRQNRMRERLALYTSAQPLLQELPALKGLLRDQELVQAVPELIWREDGSIHYASKQLRLDPALPTSIPTFFRTQFPDAPLFVRLDPLYVRAPSTAMRLEEAVIIPADPTWWRSLKIYRGEEKGSSYIIQKPHSPVDDIQAFMDHQIRRVRSLEVHAQRPKPNYLSMMVEEIQDRRDLDDQVIGLCIHLDTQAPLGEDPATSFVQHLDLAINVYEREAATQRLSQSMARDGRVVDASFRSHLLRVENVPMEILLAVALLFFRSSYLVAEWFSDQFKIDLEPAIR